MEIIKKCDLLVENFSRGVMDKYGLDYESVRKVHPAIIYVAMAAFGADGPYKDYVMYGRNQIYLSGLAHTTGHLDRPPHPINFSWGTRWRRSTRHSPRLPPCTTGIKPARASISNFPSGKA